MKVFRAALLTFVALVFPAIAVAAPITFDFESTPATFISPPDGARSGALTTLSLTVSGVTMTLTRPDSAFDIVENSGAQTGKPAGWGARSLDPFFAESSNTAFIANFSVGIKAFSMEFGDYGGDSDSMTIQAFTGANATGTLLQTLVVPYGIAAFPTIGFGSLGGPNQALSVRFIGGSASFANSVFVDNITVEAVPEPASLLLLGSGLAALGARMRRSSRAPRS
jgi:hypothetical protein